MSDGAVGAGRDFAVATASFGVNLVVRLLQCLFWERSATSRRSSVSTMSMRC